MYSSIYVVTIQRSISAPSCFTNIQMTLWVAAKEVVEEEKTTTVFTLEWMEMLDESCLVGVVVVIPQNWTEKSSSSSALFPLLCCLKVTVEKVLRTIPGIGFQEERSTACQTSAALQQSSCHAKTKLTCIRMTINGPWPANLSFH